jgi:multiple sugar transport system ATP-binding protein
VDEYNLVKLTLDHVSKFYGETKAVDNFNLDVEDKEFMSILGPSGCGKTTLLRLIAGLETNSEGQILFDDLDISEIPSRERNVSMVFQSYALFPHMTASENIGFPLSVRNETKDNISTRVHEVGNLLKISQLLDRKPRELSGGEQQRVALGRAIVRKPSILLMDEPLSNVDAKTRAYLRSELKELQREIKTTLVYVTHDQTEAMTMSHRIALMRKGKLVQVGIPEMIYEHPNDVWSASFVGSLPMNFFDCTLIDKRGVRAIGAACFAPQSPEDIMKKLDGLEHGTEFQLGVRPEDIEISKIRQSKPTCEADVHLLEPTGDSIIVDLKVEEKIMKAKVKPGFKVKEGDHVYITFDWSRAHLFLSSVELVESYLEEAKIDIAQKRYNEAAEQVSKAIENVLLQIINPFSFDQANLSITERLCILSDRGVELSEIRRDYERIKVILNKTNTMIELNRDETENMIFLAQAIIKRTKEVLLRT